MTEFILNPSTNYVGCMNNKAMMKKVLSDVTFNECKNLAETNKSTFFGLQHFNGTTGDCLFSISNDKNAFWNKLRESKSCVLTSTDVANYGVKSSYDDGISLYLTK